MIKGPRPQSSRTRELRGNPGKRAIRHDEPTPAAPVATFDTPPPELAGDRVARAEWRRLAPILRAARQITEADRGLLITLCLEWSRYRAAARLARALLVTTHNGYTTAHPAVGIARNTAALCLKLWAELGCTPSSRTRVATVSPGDGPAIPGDPFADEFDRPATH